MCPHVPVVLTEGCVMIGYPQQVLTVTITLLTLRESYMLIQNKLTFPSTGSNMQNNVGGKKLLFFPMSFPSFFTQYIRQPARQPIIAAGLWDWGHNSYSSSSQLNSFPRDFALSFLPREIFKHGDATIRSEPNFLFISENCITGTLVCCRAPEPS